MAVGPHSGPCRAGDRMTATARAARPAAQREQVVPQTCQAPGFVSGYWTRAGSSGLSMTVFESEDAARAASERARSMELQGVTVE
ncbi:MAG: hypothetical protein JO095_18130, partial [Alphaproteobacteria bacterium]|nr:hypothetical protein [Alphaproteobacteria bacterium]